MATRSADISRKTKETDIAVTVVGRSASDDGEDTVDLWREFARPPRDGRTDATA